jgi:hypothetical protein
MGRMTSSGGSLQMTCAARSASPRSAHDSDLSTAAEELIATVGTRFPTRPFQAAYRDFRERLPFEDQSTSIRLRHLPECRARVAVDPGDVGDD